MRTYDAVPPYVPRSVQLRILGDIEYKGVVQIHTKDLLAARTALLCRQRVGDAEKYTQRMEMPNSFATSIQWDLVSGSAFVLSNRGYCASSQGRTDQMVSCLSFILVLVVAVAFCIEV